MASQLAAKDRIQTLIRTESGLDDLLSQPSSADAEAMRRLEGDLLLLGVAGKMGPTLAMRARRALEAIGSTSRVIGVSRFTDTRARQALEAAGIETVTADLADSNAMRALPDS